MPNVKYFYVRNDWKKRDITIVSETFEEEGRKFVRCGWAFRSNHDKFVKKEGRTIALKRMQSEENNYSAVFEVEEFKFFNITSKILEAILTCPTTPRKYIDDIVQDLEYFTHCSVNGVVKWSWEV